MSRGGPPALLYAFVAMVAVTVAMYFLVLRGGGEDERRNLIPPATVPGVRLTLKELAFNVPVDWPHRNTADVHFTFSQLPEDLSQEDPARLKGPQIGIGREPQAKTNTAEEVRMILEPGDKADALLTERTYGKGGLRGVELRFTRGNMVGVHIYMTGPDAFAQAYGVLFWVPASQERQQAPVFRAFLDSLELK